MILPFIKQDNSVEFLISDNASLLTTVDFNVYTPVKLGLTSNNDLNCIEFQFKAWCTNGIDSVFTYVNAKDFTRAKRVEQQQKIDELYKKVPEIVDITFRRLLGKVC